MSIDKFSAKCKAEAVPDLVNLLSLDEIGSPHIPIRIDVNGSKWGRRLGDADVEVLVSAIFASGLPVAALTLSNHDITDVGVTTLCKVGAHCAGHFVSPSVLCRRCRSSAHV